MAVFAGNGSNTAPSFTFSSDTNTGMYRGASANELNFTNGGVNTLYLSSGNNAGVGVSPTYAGPFGGTQRCFMVGGTTAPQIRILSNDGTAPADLVLGAGNSARDAYIWNRNNGGIRIGVNNSDAFYFDNDGSFDVGPSIPSSSVARIDSDGGIVGVTASIGRIRASSGNGQGLQTSGALASFAATEAWSVRTPCHRYNPGTNTVAFDAPGMPDGSTIAGQGSTYLISVSAWGSSGELGGTLTMFANAYGSSTANFDTDIVNSQTWGSTNPSLSISRTDPGGGAAHQITITSNDAGRVKSVSIMMLSSTISG